MNPPTTKRMYLLPCTLTNTVKSFSSLPVQQMECMKCENIFCFYSTFYYNWDHVLSIALTALHSKDPCQGIKKLYMRWHCGGKSWEEMSWGSNVGIFWPCQVDYSFIKCPILLSEVVWALLKQESVHFHTKKLVSGAPFRSVQNIEAWLAMVATFITFLN